MGTRKNEESMSFRESRGVDFSRGLVATHPSSLPAGQTRNLGKDHRMAKRGGEDDDPAAFVGFVARRGTYAARAPLK